MTSFFKTTTICLLLCPLSACEINPAVQSAHVSVGGQHARVDIGFNRTDRELIHAYYAKAMGKQHLPPGLAKKKRLPPGLQKQLQRNGRLPPGLERDPLPYRLESKLSRLPENYLRVRIGNDIVLMNGRTNVIVDIIYNFGR